MREIKFRCWFPNANVMGLVTNLKGSNTGYVFDGVIAECFIGGRQVFYEAYQNFILMQYTGLKDKNGKEIFDGDVCRFLDENWQVIYFEPYASFMLQKGNDLQNITTQEEVIGNIYSNPDLL